LTDYEANLREFVAICRTQGSRVVLITAPNFLALANQQELPPSAFDVTDKGSVKELRALHRSYNDVVRRVAKSEGARLVDLCDIFARSADPAAYFVNPPTDFIHPSAAGFEVIATALADAVDPMLRETERGGTGR